MRLFITGKPSMGTF